MSFAQTIPYTHTHTCFIFVCIKLREWCLICSHTRVRKSLSCWFQMRSSLFVAAAAIRVHLHFPSTLAKCYPMTAIYLHHKYSFLSVLIIKKYGIFLSVVDEIFRSFWHLAVSLKYLPCSCSFTLSCLWLFVVIVYSLCLRGNCSWYFCLVALSYSSIY